MAGFSLIVVGGLVMLGSALNWWIVTRPEKLFNRLLGDNVARVLYFGIGAFAFVRGIELATGARWLPF
jgi:hypothetical protein